VPITTDRDQVRLLTGDTDAERPLLWDDEIDYFLAKAENVGNIVLAAADCADAIGAKFARDPASHSTDGQSVTTGDRVKHYRDLAQRLRRRGGVHPIGLEPGMGTGPKQSAIDID
jgi:hypothetical protein